MPITYTDELVEMTNQHGIVCPPAVGPEGSTFVDIKGRLWYAINGKWMKF